MKPMTSSGRRVQRLRAGEHQATQGGEDHADLCRLALLRHGRCFGGHSTGYPKRRRAQRGLRSVCIHADVLRTVAACSTLLKPLAPNGATAPTHAAPIPNSPPTDPCAYWCTGGVRGGCCRSPGPRRRRARSASRASARSGCGPGRRRCWGRRTRPSTRASARLRARSRRRTKNREARRAVSAGEARACAPARPRPGRRASIGAGTARSRCRSSRSTPRCCRRARCCSTPTRTTPTPAGAKDERGRLLWDPTQGTGAGSFKRVDPPIDPAHGQAGEHLVRGMSLLADGRVLVTGGNLRLHHGDARRSSPGSTTSTRSTRSTRRGRGSRTWPTAAGTRRRC